MKIISTRLRMKQNYNCISSEKVIITPTWGKHTHSYLGLLFEQERFPSTLVIDGAREQVMGEFRHKARQADCHVKQTEPYSPWQNAAEGTIRELKIVLVER